MVNHTCTSYALGPLHRKLLPATLREIAELSPVFWLLLVNSYYTEIFGLVRLHVIVFVYGCFFCVCVCMLNIFTTISLYNNLPCQPFLLSWQPCAFRVQWGEHVPPPQPGHTYWRPASCNISVEWLFSMTSFNILTSHPRSILMQLLLIIWLHFRERFGWLQCSSSQADRESVQPAAQTGM